MSAFLVATFVASDHARVSYVAPIHPHSLWSTAALDAHQRVAWCGTEKLSRLRAAKDNGAFADLVQGLVWELYSLPHSVIRSVLRRTSCRRTMRRCGVCIPRRSTRSCGRWGPGLSLSVPRCLFSLSLLSLSLVFVSRCCPLSLHVSPVCLCLCVSVFCLSVSVSSPSLPCPSPSLPLPLPSLYLHYPPNFLRFSPLLLSLCLS
jgi:hypothetical protein